MDTKQCHNPACQKPLPTKWGVVGGYRVRTGQTYCGEFCAADDELRVFNEAQKQWRRA